MLNCCDNVWNTNKRLLKSLYKSGYSGKNSDVFDEWKKDNFN
jgi:hypothetical protein